MRPTRPAIPLKPHPSHRLASRRRKYPAAERKASLRGPAHGEDDRKTASVGPDARTSSWVTTAKSEIVRRTIAVALPTSSRWPGRLRGGERRLTYLASRCVIASHDSEHQRLIDDDRTSSHPDATSTNLHDVGVRLEWVNADKRLYRQKTKGLMDSRW